MVTRKRFMDKVPLLGAARTRIVKELIQGPRTAVQLAETLGIQVSAARKHLEKLRAMGLLEVRFERAGPGRPKKFFRLTDEGQELFPRHYDSVLNALVTELVREGGESHVERTLQRVAREFAGATVPNAGADRGRVRQLASGLAELGFQPTITERAGECTITSHNCPILHTAKLHRELVCRGLHAEIIRAATGVPEVDRGKWIVDGDPVCTHTIRTA